MGTIFHIAKKSLVWATICAPNNATPTILDVFYKDHSVCDWSDESQKSTCYNAGAIFDSILSEPCERKTLVMAEKSQNLCLCLYFFKWRKQCEDQSGKENTTMQVAHEDLNDVDDPTKEILAAMA